MDRSPIVLCCLRSVPCARARDPSRLAVRVRSECVCGESGDGSDGGGGGEGKGHLGTKARGVCIGGVRVDTAEKVEGLKFWSLEVGRVCVVTTTLDIGQMQQSSHTPRPFPRFSPAVAAAAEEEEDKDEDEAKPSTSACAEARLRAAGAALYCGPPPAPCQHRGGLNGPAGEERGSAGRLGPARRWQKKAISQQSRTPIAPMQRTRFARIRARACVREGGARLGVGLAVEGPDTAAVPVAPAHPGATARQQSEPAAAAAAATGQSRQDPSSPS